MAVSPLTTPPPPAPSPPPTLSPVSPECVLGGPAPSEQPHPPDSLRLRPSPDETTRDELVQNAWNRSSNGAPKRLTEANMQIKKLQTAESPENELQAPKAPLELQFCRSSSSSSKQTAASPPLIGAEVQPTNGDPSCCVVVPGQETVLEIFKGRSGLGLSIVGGRDTQLNAIMIHEVYEEGAAARDGRLWAGDQILEVNGVNLRGASHEEAIASLRQTPAKVHLTVLRDESHYRDEENLDVFKVELQKKSGRGLGFSIVGKRSGSGVFISEVVRGGAAQMDGRVMQGDQILSVNGEDTRHVSQEAVAAMLKCARKPVLLELGRLKAASWISSRLTSKASQMSHVSSSSSAVVAPPLPQMPASPELAVTTEPLKNIKTRSDITSCCESSSGVEAGVRTVEITRGAGDSLGVSVAGGKGSPLGDIPIFIAMIQANGVAAKTHRLKVSDAWLLVSLQNSICSSLNHHIRT
ncbi:hypothetical protein CHARACLAT_022083 [Characodon lateralis]|uniref:PDZ domain-containing protein n=1 Tax=Characodon lateralis TaxID=208331 RepID=A0ABU7DIS7_9TELE|nr:hypothetical protein [Characodon lateralis]